MSAPDDKMYCILLLILLHCCKLKAQDNVFTINKVVLRADPSETVQNGKLVTLHCSVDISKSEHFLLNYTFSFSKNSRVLVTTTLDQEWAEYNISEARYSDSGDYECTLNTTGKAKNSNILTVHVKGIIRPILKSWKTSVKEGEKVRLCCEVPGEKPPFHIKFSKSKHGGASSQERTVLVEKDNFAEIEFPVAAGDTVLHFECTALMHSLTGIETSEPSQRVLVAVSEPFSIPKISIHPPENITEGDNIRIECTTIQGHQQDMEIFLQKDKKILNRTKGRESVIYATVATVEDNGNYTCKAEFLSVSKISSVNVVVSELFPKPVLHPASILHPTPIIRVDENSTLKIECHVNSSLPIYFSLMRDNRILVNNSVYTTRARLAHRGVYVCVAETKGITKKSDPVQINVYAPVSRPILSATYQLPTGAVLGQNFLLRCYSNLGTPPIYYTLYRGDKIITTKEGNESAEFTQIATDKHVQGEYRCEAWNGHSIRQQSRRLNITVIARVENVTMHVTPERVVEDGENVLFVCSVGSGSLPIEFKFFRKYEYKDELLYRVREEKKYSAAWLIEGIASQDAAKYFCTASNEADLLARSRLVTVMVVLASWKKWLIALFVLLIIGIAIVALWLCFRKKAKAKGSSLELTRSAPANNSTTEKMISEHDKGDFYYGSDYNEDGENHIKSEEENKGPDLENSEVEYTEVEVSVPDPLRAPVTKKAETVYTEIRKPNHDGVENRNSRIDVSPNGT
ncbi:platelet endothelial cell adhesion molecule isoform X2 [Tiliqua scincoides]|uniref:platelet endothelial cell adhesion molecule isoform X2 n=1 Tax=Tiliqua scincoides TaxID=71010 RepID=UPI00346334BB